MNENISKLISEAQITNKLSISNEIITEEVWSEICKLYELEAIVLINDKISDIPALFFELTNLQNIHLRGSNEFDALQFLYCSRVAYEIFDQLKRDYHDLIESKGDDLIVRIGRDFMFLANADNKVIIELFQSSSIFIYVFGKNDSRKKTLSSIRTKFDNLFNKQIDERYLKNSNDKKTDYISRFFDFPIQDSSKLIVRVDFDRLMKHKQANVNKYFDQQSGLKVDVSDLLEYIGSENDIIKGDWTGTSTITNVHIKNFKIIQNLDLNLSENINIILGNNGLGKSTILQAITLGLLPIENNDYPIGINEYIRFGEAKSEIKTNWGADESRKLSVYKQGRSDEEMPVYPPTHLLLSYGVNLNTNKQQDHSKITNALISGINDLYFTKSVFAENYINFHDPLIILKELDDHIKTELNQNRQEFKHQVLAGLGVTVDAEAKDCIQLNHLLLSCLNDYLSLVEQSERIQIVFDAKMLRYYFKDIQGNLLEIQHLSEGYRDHILLLTDIIVRILASRKLLFEGRDEISINKNLLLEARAVILIDEFDRHLHPVWQRKLLTQLKTDFPNVQFVLTTHNPMSILDRDANEIIQLKMDGNANITAETYSSGTRYTDISMIYLKYFVRDIVSKELREDIELYNRLFLTDQRNTDEFRALELKLKQANVGYAINDLRYWKFLEFLKRCPAKDPELNNEKTGDWDFSDDDWNDLIEEIQ